MIIFKDSLGHHFFETPTLVLIGKIVSTVAKGRARTNLATSHQNLKRI